MYFTVGWLIVQLILIAIVANFVIDNHRKLKKLAYKVEGIYDNKIEVALDKEIIKQIKDLVGDRASNIQNHYEWILNLVESEGLIDEIVDRINRKQVK
ncbi:MAG: hypothetical protein GY861_12670 [bacterium]|nr:hypothetical protein [bacterium]